MTTLTIKPWVMATRPKTLVATFAPIFIGAVFALQDDAFSTTNFFVALASALLIQIGTNLANDYYDFKKGADTHERVGPLRVTQAGLISPSAVFLGFALSFSLAALLGLYLVVDVGLVILWVGLASLVSGVAYTAGPWPLAYVGLGELFVLVFFGPVASGFTYYVTAHAISVEAFVAGLMPGALSCAILIANNLRDIVQDERSQKRTLAVRFGKTFARFEYACAWVLAFGVCALLALELNNLKLLAPFATLPMALKLCTRINRDQSPAEMIRILEGTAKGLTLFTVLFCIAAFL